jgi:riboflavin kinase/FMN adenylyltransferase
MNFPFKVSGKVVKGDGRGRQIGFPTANIDLSQPPKVDFDLGVYAAITTVYEKNYKSAVHIGPASTFGKSKVTFEVYILDFDEDIYDLTIEVQVVAKIRSTVKFDSVQELIKQMNKDVLTSRNILFLD